MKCRYLHRIYIAVTLLKQNRIILLTVKKKMCRKSNVTNLLLVTELIENIENAL